MRVVIEDTDFGRSLKLWILEEGINESRLYVPAGGDVWQTVRLEQGERVPDDVKPLTLNYEMAVALRDALNKALFVSTNDSAVTELVKHMREQLSTENARVDKMIDRLIDMPTVVTATRP